MTDRPTVSVVIVSHGRPEALGRCLLAVSQLRFEPYEVVIVADAAGRDAVSAMPQARAVKIVACDTANISAARNLGIAAAAGEILAFIDDDAVPEPTWLTFLTEPFTDPGIAAASGFVRGRNGISWQSQAQAVDGTGARTDLRVAPDRPTVPTPEPGTAIHTVGTNMALRRTVLARIGGFDPAFRFFLDETDLNMRLAATGARTAIAPRAEVHHGFAASRRRRADRVPTDLYEIGASWAVFLRKHCPEARRETAWRRVERDERRRALWHMQRGGLEPRDVRRLMARLKNGYRDGAARPLMPLPPCGGPTMPFQPFPGSAQARSVQIAGRCWSRLRRRAEQAVRDGANVSVFRFSPTAIYHRVTFCREGYWLQTGGLWGRSDRAQPLVAAWTFGRRLRAEADRVRIPRGLT